MLLCMTCMVLKVMLSTINYTFKKGNNLNLNKMHITIHISHVTIKQHCILETDCPLVRPLFQGKLVTFMKLIKPLW